MVFLPSSGPAAQKLQKKKCANEPKSVARAKGQESEEDAAAALPDTGEQYKTNEEDKAQQWNKFCHSVHVFGHL